MLAKLHVSTQLSILVLAFRKAKFNSVIAALHSTPKDRVRGMREANEIRPDGKKESSLLEERSRASLTLRHDPGSSKMRVIAEAKSQVLKSHRRTSGRERQGDSVSLVLRSIVDRRVEPR